MSDSITTAVILAAGMGSRLQSLGSRNPKAFLRLGSRPIIEESIVCLQEAGIRRVVIVTGYRAEQFDQLRSRYPWLVETVHNPLYAESGSMYSLSCCRDRVDEPFLLLESDLIYERRAVHECLAAPWASAVLLSGLSDVSDAVFVAASKGRLVSMSKNRQELNAPVAGELVGICKISPDLFHIMQAEADAYFQTSLHMDYETNCLVAAAQRTPVHCHLVEDLCWCEIDDAEHLRRARRFVYPEILRRDAGIAVTRRAA